VGEGIDLLIGFRGSDLTSIEGFRSYTSSEVSTYRRPRSFVAVRGPDAEDFLQRMVSNDVAVLQPGESCDALLLTPKARLIAPLRVWRRGSDDYLLLTEPELGEVVRTNLLRARFAAKCVIEAEEHTSAVVLGDAADGIPCPDYGVPAREVLDAASDGADVEELERLRIEAGTPRWGRELDDRVLPAEAGLDETAVSFTKGCYPGQEPIARLQYRGKVNRRLRVLDIESASPGDEIYYAGKAVGRVTSAAPGVALAYVRTEVPADAELEVGNGRAEMRPA
jgi:folate-binding protein YgfZ